MRGRITLRQLKAQAAHDLADAHAVAAKADQTLDQGQVLLTDIREDARKQFALLAGLLGASSDFVEDLADGVKIEIGVKPTGIAVIDSVLERWGWKLPFTLRIDPREKESSDA